MDDSREPREREHAQTFDEVIARGFPHDNLDELKKAHEERVRARSVPSAPRLARAATAPTTTRKDGQSNFNPAEQAAYKNAVERLVQDGTYLQLIEAHMDMSHDMHGSMGETGLYRFLAWHRRYPLEFERELQRADALLRPNAPEKLGVPYWRWQEPIPSWMEGFLPATDPETGRRYPRERMRRHPTKPMQMIWTSS